MTNTKKHKRRCRKLTAWRQHHNISRCVICGKSMKGESYHHIACTKCHKIKIN